MAFAYLILLTSLLLVSEPTRNVEEGEIKYVVEKFIQSKLDRPKTKIVVEYRSLPRKVLNVPKDAVLRVVDDSHIKLHNNVMLPIEVFVRDRVEHTFIVSLKIRTYSQVLIASKKIEKRELGEMIAATEERMETTMLPSDIVANHEALRGKRAKRMIKQGAVLTESMFERVPTVHQGSTVTLLVKTNSVVIKTQAIVREDGATGEVVLVQKAGTGTKFKARVIDENTVEMLAQK